MLGHAWCAKRHCCASGLGPCIPMTKVGLHTFKCHNILMCDLIALGHAGGLRPRILKKGLVVGSFSPPLRRAFGPPARWGSLSGSGLLRGTGALFTPFGYHLVLFKVRKFTGSHDFIGTSGFFACLRELSRTTRTLVLWYFGTLKQ